MLNRMIYNIGSINIDYVYRVPHLVAAGETLASRSMACVLGGKGANQSVALAKAGARVSHVGRVGTSDAWALQQMKDVGVDTRRVETSDEPSGHAIIQVDDAGENSIVLFGGANRQLTRQQLDNALNEAAESDWLLIQNECNAVRDVFEFASQKGCPLAFNPAPMEAAVLELPLSGVHCLIVNEVEANELVDGQSLAPEELVRSLMQRFPDALTALTLGAAGVRLIDHGTVTSIDSPKVKAVDSTGAGDTFVGYLLAGLVAGKPAEEAARTACSAAALSVTRAGATPAIPAENDVLEFMQPHAAGQTS